MTPCLRLLIASTAFFLAACASETAPSAARLACGGDTNLLQNPTFARDGENRMVPWRAGQHAGENSFRFEVDDGVLTIERIATQPWYYFVQDPAIEDLKGHDMLYQAELKLSLSDEGYDPSWEPGGGLHVLIWGQVGPAIAGSRQIFDSTFEHEPSIGETDWFTAELSFTIPPNTTKMQVGVEQRASGSMSVRNPVLLDCGPAASS